MSKFLAKISKTVFVILVVCTLTLFAGCDLISSIVDDVNGGGKKEKPDVVKISPLSAQVEVGATVTLTATSSEGRAISWTSEDEEIATVDDGEVTGVAEGTATITASDGKQMAHCEITVIPAENQGGGEGDGSGDDEKDPPAPPAPKPTIKLSSTAITISEGDSYNLLATVSDSSKVSWTTSNKSVATVTNGNVKGIKAGTATITASSETAGSATCKVTVVAVPKTEYKLVWSDEFDGNSLDMTKWEYQTGTQDHYGNSWGPQYWGNGELQYYTNGSNLKVSDGELQITAKREGMGDRPFTSTRIATRDKYTVKYGIIEARMKTPAIDGMWPAFWMLPNPANHNSTNNVYGSWPASGEIDIMEAKGREKNEVDCTLHFGGPEWNIHDMAGKGDVVLSSNTDQWHTYAVEWTADYIAWIIDGKEIGRVPNSRYWTNPPTGAATNASSPFDQPYYILLNLAVGGMYDNYVNPPDSFTEATMYVDYVRVYQQVPVTE